MGGGATTLRRRHGEPRIHAGKLFRSRDRRRHHLHRIRSGQPKGRDLALRHRGAGWNRADREFRRGAQPVRNLGRRSHRGLGQRRSARRRAHSFRRGRAGKRFQRQQVGHRGIRFRQVQLGRVRYGFSQACCRAPPEWFGWDGAPRVRRTARNGPLPRHRRLPFAAVRCWNSK